MKVYRGAAAAARHYVEADRSRADDYYLAEGTGLAERYIAGPDLAGGDVQRLEPMDGDAYERWVAGCDPETELARGRLRKDEQAVRFVEVTVNGPKSWSLAAAVNPEIATAYDEAQTRAAGEITAYLANHLTTRVGPRGRQVQVPVERIEVAVVAHRTSRAGDPHRHLHLQLNARVWAMGKWRGVHTVGVRDTLDAINGIGTAAVMCHPGFRSALAAHGYTLDPITEEIVELAPYVGAFSARAQQIGRNVDRYEAQWRAEYPGEEPGRRLLQAWDTRAWKDARPDKVVPVDGRAMNQVWVDHLRQLGFRPPRRWPLHRRRGGPEPTRIGELDRDQIAEVVVSRLGAARSAWNHADVRGEVERQIARAGVITESVVRTELAEDLTSRALARSVPLLDQEDVPEHVRALTSPRVVAVERALTRCLTSQAARASHRQPSTSMPALRLDNAQQQVVAALSGAFDLVVVEGAAGAGKTTTLAAARDALAAHHRRLVVVSPTHKAVGVAKRQLGSPCVVAARLTYQYGFRWDTDGHWSRVKSVSVDRETELRAGDVLLVDEAGMLDQDTALALMTVASERGCSVALMGDRRQIPAVGRGGVLDLAARWVRPQEHITLDTVHRFLDPEYAELTLLMRTGERSGEVFDRLLSRGQVHIHATDVECLHALAQRGTDPGRPLLVAGTNQQVNRLNATVRDRLVSNGEVDDARVLVTYGGQRIGTGDRVATRDNDPELGVANRDVWTVTKVERGGTLHLSSEAGDRVVPAWYGLQDVELAYATTTHGAQGDTVDQADLLIDEHTSGKSAYVGMTRGRQENVAHLVADSVEDARRQWIETFGRDRSDLGPAAAAAQAAQDVDNYGTQVQRRVPSVILQAAVLREHRLGIRPRATSMPPPPPPSEPPGPVGPSR